MIDIRIDSEFASLIPALSADERSQLEALIVAEGCREALVVWKEEGVLLDGHNRFGICKTHEIEFRTKALSFADRDAAKRWMLENQLGRRNLTPESVAYLRGKLYREENKGHGGDRSEASGQNAHLKTAERLAAAHGVDEKTIRRDAKFSEQLDTLANDLGEDFRQQVLSRDAKVTRKDVAELARMKEDERRTVVAAVESGSTGRDAIRDHNRNERITKLADISANDTALSTDAKFPVLYADPPWRYEHVKTDSRAIENQYPTMDLDEIRGLPVSEVTTDDAILFLWATSPKLAESISVIEAWGFTYRTCMVWVKDKIGMGYYARQRHELLLICTKGKPPVPRPEDRPDSVVEAKRSKHSAKPFEFYELIEQMYPELPKMELFCRKPRDGWVAWGNQVKEAS